MCFFNIFVAYLLTLRLSFCLFCFFFIEQTCVVAYEVVAGKSATSVEEVPGGALLDEIDAAVTDVDEGSTGGDIEDTAGELMGDADGGATVDTAG